MGCRCVRDNCGGFPDSVLQTAVNDTDCLGAMSISGKSRKIHPFGTAVYGIDHSPRILASSQVVIVTARNPLASAAAATACSSIAARPCEGIGSSWLI